MPVHGYVFVSLGGQMCIRLHTVHNRGSRSSRANLNGNAVQIMHPSDSTLRISDSTSHSHNP